MSGMAPRSVKIIYRKVGSTHVFTSPEFPGLHIGASCKRRAYRALGCALSGHASFVLGRNVKYELPVFSDAFLTPRPA